MEPTVSYTIWFSQRTGSTLLTTALEATGIAGRPREWLLGSEGTRPPVDADAETAQAYVATLRRRGTTKNGVFGAKVSWYEPRMGEAFALLRTAFPALRKASRPALWEAAFPNHRHVFMTRRNKVRQAVSWWRAVRSGEWHRRRGEAARPAPDADGGYNFEAIDQLFAEAAMREAGIQAFFSEADIIPLTVVYEDFVLDYERTMRRCLMHLEVDPLVTVPKPSFERIADDVTESWVARFRKERQAGWQHRGW